MKKVTFVLIVINICMFVYISFFEGNVKLSMAETEAAEREAYLNIVTTDKYSYEMVKKVVGSKHNVKYLFKSKEEMYNYEPTKEAMSNISTMDLFIYLGAENEPWINEFINGLDKGRVGIIDLSRGIRILNYNEAKKINEQVIHNNPNYLLSPEEYKVALYNIKTAIQEKDMENKDYYEENFNKERKIFDKEIEAIQEELAKGEKVNFYSLDEEGEYLFTYLGIKVSKIKEEQLKDIEESKDIFNKDEKNILILWDNGQSLEEYEIISEGTLEVLKLNDFNSNLKVSDILIGNLKGISEEVKKVEENKENS